MNKDIENRVIYYHDFEFIGSGLAVENVYIVDKTNGKQHKIVNNPKEKSTIQKNVYEIYDDKNNLIATVTEDGKVHFSTEFIEKLKSIDERYFEQLNMNNLDFQLPKLQKDKDRALTAKEIDKYMERQQKKKNEKGIKPIGEDKKKAEKEDEENKKEQNAKKETEEEKREKTAEALNINENQIKAISTIDPNQKVTDKYNLIDMMPEAAEYETISIVYSSTNEKNHGQFTVLGVKSDGTRQIINSIEPVEGTTGNKSVISINEDGSQVTEKQVKGLMRINSRNRDDGLAISIGSYGMMDINYVSNVMDKENRRSTPIRTLEAENQRVMTYDVRENAGDSKQEVQKEGKMYRENKENGIDAQTIDGIETDSINNGITLEELKTQIKDAALERGDMPKGEMQEFIKSELEKSNLELSEEEVDKATEEIEIDVIDESRFPTRGNRN